MDLPTILWTFDVLSALLGLLVAAFFLRVWRISGEARYLLFAIGLAMLGLSFATVAPSTFGTAAGTDAWDYLRLVGQTGSALVVLFTYLSARWNDRPVFTVFAAVTAALCVLAAVLVFVVPPTARLPDDRVTLAFGHGAMLLAWSATTVLSARNAWRHPRRDRLLVPGAFACFAASKYTWLLLDLVDVPRLSLLIYPWRFLGLVLLLVALTPRRAEVPDAST